MPLPSFSCPRFCKHKRCRPHAPSPVLEEMRECLCLGRVNEASLTIRLVRDISTTLHDIMIICGIPRCNARLSRDVIITAFLHCDTVYFCLYAKPKKSIRKRELREQLASRCYMSKAQIQLASVIVEHGFKAFHHVPSADTFNAYSGERLLPCLLQLGEECVYLKAAERTLRFFARFAGLSAGELYRYQMKIREAYLKFLHKMQDYFARPLIVDCYCCKCAQRRKADPRKKIREMLYECKWGRKPSQASVRRTRQAEAKRKEAAKRGVGAAGGAAYDFALKWVESIWAQPAFHQYYSKEIASHCERIDRTNFCRPLTLSEIELRMEEAEAIGEPPPPPADPCKSVH